MSGAVTRWYAVGLVERPAKGNAPARYEKVYQEAPLTTPLTRAQIERLHTARGGLPTFRTSPPPWERPQEPPNTPDGASVALDGAAIAGAAVGGLWAVFCAVAPFVALSC